MLTQSSWVVTVMCFQGMFQTVVNSSEIVQSVKTSIGRRTPACWDTMYSVSTPPLLCKCVTECIMCSVFRTHLHVQSFPHNTLVYFSCFSSMKWNVNVAVWKNLFISFSLTCLFCQVYQSLWTNSVSPFHDISSLNIISAPKRQWKPSCSVWQTPKQVYQSVASKELKLLKILVTHYLWSLSL